MNGSPRTQRVVFIDADNTLWDTDSVFAAAHLALFAQVEKAVGTTAPQTDRLAYLRAIDQILAERHHAGLRYPPRLLARALALALKGLPLETAARLAWSGGREGAGLPDEVAKRIENEFLTTVRSPPPLRPGVRDGLADLKKAGCILVVLTEGSRDTVQRTAARHSIVAFDRIIEGRKDRRLFERIIRLVGTSSTIYMIGDQLERDIRPAKEAGLNTIFFPSGFRPRWEPEEAAVLPDHRIDTFDEVPAIVLATAQKGGT